MVFNATFNNISVIQKMYVAKKKPPNLALTVTLNIVSVLNVTLNVSLIVAQTPTVWFDYGV